MQKWWRPLVVAALFSVAAFELISRTSSVSGASTSQLYLPLVLQTYHAPGWSPTGSMVGARTNHTATLLPTSQVLVAGGLGGTGGGASQRTAELYDPPTGAWLKVPKMISPRANHTATLLHPVGPFPPQVLLAGGTDAGNTQIVAERYVTASGTWSPTASTMVVSRADHTATLLPSGKVLVAGGRSGPLTGANGAPTNTAELYDPSSDTWSQTGSMASARYNHTATLLPNGRVLVAGGWSTVLNGSGIPIATFINGAELYDPATGTWSPTGGMSDPRAYHTATLLPNGTVLVAGGTADATHLRAELYNPSTGTWTLAGSLSTSRYFHTATLLLNGKVLVAGGGAGLSSYATAELYDPSTKLWTPTISLFSARQSHTATLLSSGDVLVAGGSFNVNSVSTVLASAEVHGG